VTPTAPCPPVADQQLDDRRNTHRARHAHPQGVLPAWRLATTATCPAHFSQQQQQQQQQQQRWS
jgi:hypothetical protein